MDKWLEKAKSAVRCHPKTDSCSICSDLLRDERVAFFYGTDGRNGKARFKDCKFFFHKQRHSPSRYDEKLCTSCAHLGVERLVPACENYLTGSKFKRVKIKVLLDPLTDMQARRNNCLLCALITGMISREGEIDSKHRALLKITSQICNFSSRESHLQIVLIGMKAECRLIAELFYDSKDYWERKLGLYNGQAPLLEPSVKGIDWEMVKGWIEENPKRPTFKKPPVDFRLIDVDERRVAQVTELQDYVCLSYVWGTDTSFQATFEILDDLEKPNSLAGSGVPRTIRHAMRACAALGKRYLWVDRLCIIQDEEENPSKQIQIDAMGEIYGSAWLTIVAIEGTSADYGLHGVSPSLERVPSYQIYLGGEGLSEKIPSLSSICNDRMWTTRGWTYQEAILSPRLLFFTKHGLFYEHDNFARGRDNRTKNDIQSWIYELNSPQFHSLSQSLPLRYLYVASKITQREFGHEGDIVNGFAGILDFILGKGNHRFAMPLTELPSAICWKPSSGHQNLGGRRQPRGSTAFPSWSWASIRDKPKFEYSRFVIPIASWALMDKGTADGLRLLIPDYFKYVFDDEWYTIEALLWNNGCILTKISYYLKEKHVSIKSFPPVLLEKQKKRLLKSFTSDQMQAAKADTSLLCHSQTITLGVQVSPKGELGIYYQNKEIGSMSFDLPSEDFNAREMMQNEPMNMDFLALSVSWDLSYWTYKWHHDALKGLDQIRPFDPTDFRYRSGLDGNTKFKVINTHIMAIRTTDGISRRLGIGYIPLVTWLTLLKPTWKSFVLQ